MAFLQAFRAIRFGAGFERSLDSVQSGGNWNIHGTNSWMGISISVVFMVGLTSRSDDGQV